MTSVGHEPNDFRLRPEQLSELHDPKSLAAFDSLFDNEPANLYKYLHTDPVKGLGVQDEDIPQTSRYKMYGDNRIPQRKAKPFWRLAWEAFHDQTMILLTVAAVVSFALGLYETLGQPAEYDHEGKKITKVDWVEGVAIMIAVLVVILVGSANDYQKERQFARLNEKKTDREIVVLRGGEEHLISIHDLLVGDVVTLQTGEVVPADCILIDGSCACDESALTGESDTIKKVGLETAFNKFKLLSENDAGIDIGGRFKGERVLDPMLISGSKLLSGLGKAVVTSVGEHSINGRTLMALKVEPESTPLQERLDGLANNISIYGSVAALILFIILFGRFLSYLPAGKKLHDLTPAQKGSKFMNIFITAITVIVVAVPEGLPLAVTLALAFATTRMTKDGNLVRVLRACETMGSATAVCSDKTGTLTENRMTVVKGFLGLTSFDETESTDPSMEGSDLEDVLAKTCDQKLRTDILTNIALNSTAFENKQDTGEAESNENPFHKSTKSILPWSRNNKRKKSSNDDLIDNIDKLQREPFIGSKTETALLSFAKKNLRMSDLHGLREDPKRLGVEKIVQVIPFESSRKWGGIIVKYNDGIYRFYVKGAAELILRRCQQRTRSDGSSEVLSTEAREESAQTIQHLTTGALRAISLAHQDFPNCQSWPPQHLKDSVDPSSVSPELIFGEEQSLPKSTPSTPGTAVSASESGLSLDAIVGIQDPLREGVKQSVEQCQKAGVTVRMVTGDNILTATAIAKNCSILSPENAKDPESAMEGPVFRKLSSKERIRILPKLRVLARSSPEDKRVLVETLKKMGDVVSVTGDGTNDAPALKLADIGFSMGIAGTEVAREASDIILMTDDFSAIVNAIKWGRCVSASIKKFIQFQLTVNITAVTLTFVSALASAEENSVLTAVQLLWVNLIMDTLAALALATDKPDEHILERKPKGRDAVLIAVSTWKMILGQAALQLTVTFTLHFAGGKIFFPHKKSLTGHEQQQLSAMTFNTFVWLQFFKLIVTRKLDEADGIKNVRDRVTASNLNFFQDFLRNYYFLVIALFIGGFQVLIMFVGGAAFSIARQTGAMWATAIICGLLALPMGALIRIIPDEWVLKVFPARLVNAVLYVLGFKFLRRSSKKSEDEESLLVQDADATLVSSTAFERAKNEMTFAKGHRGDEGSRLNPIHAFKKWRQSNSSAGSDLEDRSYIASVTMVPTLVGGAVGGFSHISANDGDSLEKKST
ncbi:LAME_0H05072g1_1 [Lachancea meyersii CBS 8951]|uniref:Calcium-transporting ATPase n=1 Tax=Lachancea meyersii CBS 8951 TaxID=1266667 RepID=A0A1G4KE61_9SACH|nr:LAME_0H05072g1_1 [Lachancea meyersii CBS 8951]